MTCRLEIRKSSCDSSFEIDTFRLKSRRSAFENESKMARRMCKRDREPSRIHKAKLCRLMRKRSKRKYFNFFLRHFIPGSSELYSLRKVHIYKLWLLKYSGNNFYGSYYFKKWKRDKSTREASCVPLRKFSSLQILNGGMNFDDEKLVQTNLNHENNPYSRLTERLSLKGLRPFDVGGCGDCFFRAISHQYYGTPEFHTVVRQAGINNLKAHPELFIESIANDSWKTYLQRMAAPGTWCDNIIIQAVANELNCVIHIIESRLSCVNGSTVTTTQNRGKPRVLFVGYIEDLHYVSTVPHTLNVNVLKYLKTKFSETDDEHKKRLQRKRLQYAKTKIAKKPCTQNSKTKPTANNLDSQNSNTVAFASKSHAKNSDTAVSNNSSHESNNTICTAKHFHTNGRSTTATISKSCVKSRNTTAPANKSQAKKSDTTATTKEPRAQNKHKILEKNNYLASFDTQSNGDIHEQKWARTNMNNFHKANEYKICQCTVCYEAWPLKSNSKLNKLPTYQCSRCYGEKELPKKFSKENNMVPSSVPNELSGLTQVEEMLIARALPIMHIYLKQGGQRGYSGHCVNLPQNVGELAKSLPRYPKDLSVIVVKMKGKENSFKTLNVRRQIVADALFWLLKNNPHYLDVELDQDALNSLPNNAVPDSLLSVETQDTANLNDALNFSPDRGPSSLDEEDVVFNRDTDTSSVLPMPNAEQQEIEFIQQQVQGQINWPSVENSPLNEYTTSFLATMAFPTLFPDGKGDPTNPSLHKHVTLGEKNKAFMQICREEKWVLALSFRAASKIFLLGFKHDSKSTNFATKWHILKTESWRTTPNHR